MIILDTTMKSQGSIHSGSSRLRSLNRLAYTDARLAWITGRTWLAEKRKFHAHFGNDCFLYFASLVVDQILDVDYGQSDMVIQTGRRG